MTAGRDVDAGHQNPDPSCCATFAGRTDTNTPSAMQIARHPIPAQRSHGGSYSELSHSQTLILPLLPFLFLYWQDPPSSLLGSVSLVPCLLSAFSLSDQSAARHMPHIVDLRHEKVTTHTFHRFGNLVMTEEGHSMKWERRMERNCTSVAHGHLPSPSQHCL